jgi:hypothetical protein
MVEFDSNAAARFVRIELGNPGHLHLDQVKIFGTRMDTIRAVDSRNVTRQA